MRYRKSKSPAGDKGVHPLIIWVFSQMEEQRMTHEEVAKRANISATTLRNWFQGRSAPKLHQAEDVVNAVNGVINVRRCREPEHDGAHTGH